MVQFNSEIFKRHISPEIDVQINPALDDLHSEFDQANHWFANYFLNSALCGAFQESTRAYAESMIARIQFTFAGYQQARVATIDYAQKWEAGNSGIRRYLNAIGEWERVFINLQINYDLMNKCFDASIKDGENRARLIANRIKHVSEDIRDGQLTGPGLPLWLSADGFRTITTELSYAEMTGQVRFLARVANCLSVPSEALERFAALDAEVVSGEQ